MVTKLLIEGVPSGLGLFLSAELAGVLQSVSFFSRSVCEQRFDGSGSLLVKVVIVF